MNIKKKIVELMPKKEKNINEQEMSLIQEIKVPDLKQYLIDGYEEIRKVKEENNELERKLEEQSKNEILYKSTLVALEEFKKRDEENKLKIKELKEKIQFKQDEIYDLNDKLNNYKIQEKEIIKIKKNLENEINKAKEETKLNCIDEIKYKINKMRGSLSKAKILDEITNI